MIFSSQEIDFIAETKEAYSIYRVYYGENNMPYVRICDDFESIAMDIHAYTNNYKENLNKVETVLQSAKLAIMPESNRFNFKQGILLQ
jgi:hypothetical protein